MYWVLYVQLPLTVVKQIASFTCSSLSPWFPLCSAPSVELPFAISAEAFTSCSTSFVFFCFFPSANQIHTTRSNAISHKDFILSSTLATVLYQWKPVSHSLIYSGFHWTEQTTGCRNKYTKVVYVIQCDQNNSLFFCWYSITILLQPLKLFIGSLGNCICIKLCSILESPLVN